ncbi:BnaC05g51300D [Brassica napus]|uniref:BnaC05g51300D protein n=1 Tax=Brassica napus TaxID=3708 RepID=A0A078JZZ5_BRANA|nr:BnaC05g51300D [Brassica napus]
MASPVVRTHQKSVNSPTLVAATPGKEFGPKKNLAKELEKESGLKRTLDEEFGSADVAFKWKEKAEVKKKAAEDKKKRLKLRKNRCKVQPDVEDSSLADITDKVVAEQNEFAPESDVENSEFVDCLALGVTFDGINDQNIQGLRMKMAADILAEGGNVVTDQMMAK